MNAIVDEARRWKGVRYLHQGRNRFGLDCGGLIIAVYAALGISLRDFRAYGTEPDPERLVAHLRELFGDEVAIGPVCADSLHAGDILVFRFPRASNTPRHLGFVADRIGGGFNFIEANGNEGGVIERRLDEKYMSHVTHVFRRPV